VGDDFVETPVIFGDGRLFGIYCRPISRPSMAPGVRTASGIHLSISTEVLETSATAVLFVNTAGSYHIGEARMWVMQARSLARRGVATLRMDVGKIGDSETATASITTDALHDKRSVQDVGIGIDWLIHAGYVNTTVVGICSGAYLAFHAVSDHPSASGAVLINLRQYIWSEGRGPVSNPAVASTALYMQSMRSMAKWSSLLSGKTKWRPIVKGLVIRRLQRWKDTATYLLSSLTDLDTPKRLVRRKLQVLAQRGAKMQFIYGAFDEGREQAELLLGKDFNWLHRLPNIRAITEGSLDHALFLYPAREVLTRAVEAHIGLSPIADAPEAVFFEYVGSSALPLRRLADRVPRTL